MAETRKSDYTGDVFGEWTVIAKVEPRGDRKRRWTVSNGETEMEVEQTSLRDLALAKKLKDHHAIPVLGQDESNVFENAFTLTEAEVDLYQRLDAQIAEARTLDFPVPAEWTAVIRENPFADVREFEECPDCDEDEELRAAIYDRGETVELPEGVVGVTPDGKVHRRTASFPSDMMGEVARVEAELTAALQDATGDDSLSVVYVKTPLIKPLVGNTTTPLPVQHEPTQEIQIAIDLILKAKVNLNTAIKNLEDVLSG